MSNATILQNHNEIIGNNNNSIDELIESINNLPEAGGGVVPTETIDIIENGSYDVTEYATANVNVPNDTSEIEEAFIKRTFTEYRNDTITSIGNSAFRTCKQLTSVSFANSTDTGDYAFYDCSKLTDLNFPKAKGVSTQCFRGCSSLVEVTFPEATYVEAYAFYGDKALTIVKLPKVKSFGVSALNGCTGLTTLIIEQTDEICTLAGNVFANSSVASGTGYVYVPDTLLETYKNYTNWSAYASQIKPLSELGE